MRTAGILRIASLLVVGSACVPTPPDSECASDADCHARNQCDMGRGICVPRGSVSSLGGSSGSVASSGAGSSSAPGEGAIRVFELHAAWTTPNTIRWDWSREGTRDDFGRYELVVGLSEQSVAERGAGTVVWTVSSRPELGKFELPHTQSGDDVVFTTTTGHAPATDHYAQLVAVDSLNRVSKSNIAYARTTDIATFERVIFDDTNTAGYSIPGEFALSDSMPHCGSASYRFDVDCDPHDGGAIPGACWENLRRQAINESLAAIDVGSFNDAAFFEIAIAYRGAAPAFWSDLWLRFRGVDPDLYHYDGWTLPGDGEYHVVQVPLRMFRAGDQRLAHATLSSTLHEFNVGGEFTHDGGVFVDCIRVAW